MPRCPPTDCCPGHIAAGACHRNHHGLRIAEHSSVMSRPLLHTQRVMTEAKANTNNLYNVPFQYGHGRAKNNSARRTQHANTEKHPLTRATRTGQPGLECLLTPPTARINRHNDQETSCFGRSNQRPTRLRASVANRMRSSRADTVMFMSLNITLVCTTVPASRQIGQILSGATTRERNLPDTWGKLPCNWSRHAPHSQWDSVICSGNRTRSNTRAVA